MKTGSIVKIKWFDAWKEGDRQIYDITEVKDVKTVLEDVGFYLLEKDEYVVIAEERGEDDYYRHLHYIPRVNVIEIEVLRQ